MTVTQRKPQHLPDEIQTVNEPGVQYNCDSCACDLTHTIRIKCADPVCEPDDGVDICPACFCAGKEFRKHKRWHAYRVIEINSYPIFTEDWGADEELLLLTGITSQGIGNWKKIAEHVGTRTKAEVEEHYHKVYVDSPDWPLPRMDLTFSIAPDVFHERKRRRIAAMTTSDPPLPKVAPTSAPGVHEIATFLPGRLEFEHELDNDAEDLVKDLEFGSVLDFGGDQIVEDETDLDVRARVKWEEERRLELVTPPVAHPPPQQQQMVRAHVPGKSAPAPATAAAALAATTGPLVNGQTNGVVGVNGYHANFGNGSAVVVAKPEASLKSEDVVMGNGTALLLDEDGVEEVTQPPPIETAESLRFKLTLVEMYAQRVEKRLETKAVIFERGLLEYKKMQAAEKKRPREEREFVHRLRPFARLQTAEDYEAFAADMLYEAILRKRIQELQTYRRLGLCTPADIDKYDVDVAKRAQAKAAAPARDYHASERLQAVRAVGRASSGPDPRRSSLTSSFPGDAEDRRSNEREMTPRLNPSVSGTGLPVRRPPAPLNLANSPSLHLLTPAEQTLCSQLRILPKPYLVIKETLVREYARRGGKLRRREARDLVKIDVNKTSRVWDFLVQAGFLKITTEPVVPPTQDAGAAAAAAARASSTPSLSGSPMKDTQAFLSPRQPALSTPGLGGGASSSSASISQNGSHYSSSSSVPTVAPAWPHS